MKFILSGADAGYSKNRKKNSRVILSEPEFVYNDWFRVSGETVDDRITELFFWENLNE